MIPQFYKYRINRSDLVYTTSRSESYDKDPLYTSNSFIGYCQNFFVIYDRVI